MEHRVCLNKMIVVFMTAFFSMKLNASESKSSQQETIKVGSFAMDGYHMMDEQGDKSGYGNEGEACENGI